MPFHMDPEVKSGRFSRCAGGDDFTVYREYGRGEQEKETHPAPSPGSMEPPSGRTDDRNSRI
jgi:hypothetical protein